MAIALKNHRAEQQLYTSRALCCLIASLLALFFLVGRLVYLQIMQHQLFTTLSHNNHVTIIPIPPTRGLIYDRNGILLANNIPAFNLEIIPEQVENLKETLARLKTVLNLSEEELQVFYSRLKRSRSFESVPVKMQLNDEAVAQFSVHRHLLPGVKITASLIRHYPFGKATAHVIGYVSRISEQELKTIDKANYRGTHFIGKSGIERFYETELHGKIGYRQVETDARGRIVRILVDHPAEAGHDLYLSLDYNLQQEALAALGTHRGAVVALDPDTAEVLAFASAPSFDPNSFVSGIDKKSYQALTQSPDQPLFNRALRGQYPPASTVKPIFGLAALEEGYTHPRYEIFDRGSFQLHGEGRAYRDWRPRGHGWTNLNKALYESCDTYFYELAQKMGIDTMHKWMQAFGLGQATGIDLKGESIGVAPSRAWKRSARKESWFPGETIITGIGQGYALATPLQLAMVASTFANRGLSQTPHLGLYWKNGTNPPTPIHLKNTRPSILIPIQKAELWETIIEGMRNVVTNERGTAHRIQKNLSYPLAAKTGTAQVFSLEEHEKYNVNEIDERLRDHTLLIGFSPIDHPKIALAIILENSKGSPEVALRVLNYYLARSL